MEKKIADHLKTLFTSLPIDLVYLYGSQALGKTDKFSDYDFGILFNNKLSADRRFDLRLQLFGKIAGTLNIEEEIIDVVDMQEVTLLLAFNIITGRVIFNVNESRRIIFETYIMSRYHDEHYYLDRYFAETLEKIEKGDYFDRSVSYS